MSFILSPAAPSEAPSFAPASEARFETDRGSTFGPALSEARERLANPEAGRHDPAERRTARADRSDRPDRSDRSDRLDRPERSDRSRAGEQPDRVDRGSEHNKRSGPDGANDAPQTDHLEDDAAIEERTDAELTPVGDLPTADAVTPVAEPLAVLGVTPAVELSDTDASSSVEAATAAVPLATANGAAGEGDPLIDLTVEAVAAPDAAGESVDVDASVITDGVTEVDMEAMTGATTDAADSDVATMGRQAALTSLEQVSDANLSLAERIRPATTEEVAGPSISIDDADRSDPFTQLPGDDASGDVAMQGRIDETNTQRAAAADPGRTRLPATNPATDAAHAAAVDVPDATTDATEPSVPQAAINTVPATDSPDAVVVLAREATAPTEGVRAAPTATTRTAPSLPMAAEANLWADVRSAFDRIRTNGDGQELLMRLRPAELGELLVQVRTQGDHVSVRLVTSSAAAQQTLVDDRLRLAAELARAGFDEGSVDIGQSNTGDANQRGDQGGNDSDADRAGQSFGATTGLDRIGTARDIFERREPIRTEVGFRPGRTAQSTINITL